MSAVRSTEVRKQTEKWTVADLPHSCITQQTLYPSLNWGPLLENLCSREEIKITNSHKSQREPLSCGVLTVLPTLWWPELTSVLHLMSRFAPADVVNAWCPSLVIAKIHTLWNTVSCWWEQDKLEVTEGHATSTLKTCLADLCAPGAKAVKETLDGEALLQHLDAGCQTQMCSIYFPHILLKLQHCTNYQISFSWLWPFSRLSVVEHHCMTRLLTQTVVKSLTRTSWVMQNQHVSISRWKHVAGKFTQMLETSLLLVITSMDAVKQTQVSALGLQHSGHLPNPVS